MSGSSGLAARLLVLLACVALAVLAPAPARAAAATNERGFIVQLEADPLASYTGGVQGIPATSPRVTGQRLRTRSSAARRYRSYLAGEQRAALARVPGAAPELLHRYRTAFAGFAARLTPDQVAALRAAPEVARVWRDELRELTQAPSGEAARAALGGFHGDGASYLGLPTGLWERLGGVDAAGEGVIVGVIDTGIVPEHPSFADDPSEGFVGSPYEPPEVWAGVCEAGERFTTEDCNGKLIGARFFVEGFRRDRLAAGSFVSPRDDDGHGSHTAGTAAGNYGVDPVIAGNDLGVGVISGIAPRAHVAAYKACWNGREFDGCFLVDTVAAIDAAVADGVDVINYSIGGPSEVLGPDGVAFLGASDAGVFVATSAGNRGPDAGTIGSPGDLPWVTSVAASTLARKFEARLTVYSPGARLVIGGASVSRGIGVRRLVDGAAAAAEGADPDEAAQCLADTLDPAAVRGAIVLCRGNRGRSAKARVVEEAGGVAMVLYNPEGAESLLTDNHRIPGIHISHEDGEAIKAVIGPATRAEFTRGRERPRRRGGVLADFSSRGPQEAVPDIGKPDVTAPGVQILAANAPELPPSSPFLPGQLFQVISGTSMSSPHVAGAAALLHQLHPLFSPAELRSSLMTSADPDVLLEDGRTRATPLDTGSGEIDPNAAADPGLVLDATTTDYLRYLEGIDPSIVRGDIPPLRAPDLNLPSIAFGRVTGTESTERTFRSVESRSRRWNVSVEQPAGATLTPSTLSFTIRPGQTRTLGLDIEVVDVPVGEYTFGALVLESGERRVRLPVSLRPILVDVPEVVRVETDAVAGSSRFTVASGFGGTLSALGWGLAAPEVAAGETITTTTGEPELDPPDAGTKLYPVAVPEGAQLLAAQISNTDGGAAGRDLDLYLFRDPNGDGDLGDAELVDFDADADADETVRVPLPEAGSYVWAVVGFTTASPASTYDFTRWLAADPSPDDPEPPPGLAVTGDPVEVSPGAGVSLSVEWSGVEAPGTYLGVATFHEGAPPALENLREFSIVEVVRGASP